MPGIAVLVGAAAGALITFVLTSGRWWWQRRRRAKDAAKELMPQLVALNAAVTNALADRSWQPVNQLALTDHALPRLAMTIANGLPTKTADPFVDGVLAVHELDEARQSLHFTSPREREQIENYRRRIDTASAITATLASKLDAPKQHLQSKA